MPRPRVLVVDDEEAIRDALAFSLGAAGFEVRSAATGGAGLELALAERFDAVLLDLLLPDIQGDVVCARLRAALASPPAVVLVTARTDPDAEALGRACGADAFVTKPFRLADLVGRLRELAGAG